MPFDLLKKAEEDLQSNLAAITRLHSLGLISTQKVKMREVLMEIVDAAIEITKADFGNIQLIHPSTRRLRIEAQRGFSKEWVEFWDNVGEGHGACGTALVCEERIIVEDVEQSEIFIGTDGLKVLIESGVRAVQSTPLVSRSGQMLGMFSTHYRKPHHPDHRTLELLDLLARQAADLIEQRQAQGALKERSKELVRLAGELTLAEHRERQRIANHLHDNLQQWLVGARLQAQAISRFVPKKAKESFEMLGYALKEAIEATRDLSRELAPPVSGSLPETFNWMANEVRRQHLLDVEVDIRGSFENVTEPQGILLYSAARELLLNIVKHSGVLAARLELAGTDHGLTLKVSDKGCGYNPQTLAASKTHGLGLFSIRERVALMGGKIMAESALNQGTTTVVELPIIAVARVVGGGSLNLEDEDGGDLTAEKATTPSGGIRVVFVDDHRIVRESLVALIDGEPDIDVVGQCENGRQAVEHARRLKPDVFVMDGNMPVMDGIEATRAIKSRWPSIKVIGLSMMEEREGGAKMLAAGADEYVSKSGPTEELVAAIRRCCSSQDTPKKRARRVVSRKSKKK